MLLFYLFFGVIMKKITAFACDVCNELMIDEKDMLIHEENCIKRKEYFNQKVLKQNEAKAYLSKFRKDATSVKHFFSMIEDEMDLIIQAAKTIMYYDNPNRKIKGYHNFNYKLESYSNPETHFPTQMTHSSPVGKSRTKGFGKKGNPTSDAFNLRVSFSTYGQGCEPDFINLIEGINTGTGGGGSGEYSYDFTFWLEDFPNKLRNE